MIGKIRFSRWLVGAAILVAAECASVVTIELAVTEPAQAQFFGTDRSYRRPQRSGGFFEDLFGPQNRRVYEGDSEPSSGPSDNSRAPSPRKDSKSDQAPTTSVVVLGDGMADWLAYGLEDAFSDSPEIGIIRKNKAHSGLLRYEAKGDLDWWHVARDILATEKPSYVIMMLGINDRQSIREKDLAKEADKKKDADKAAAGKTDDANKTDANKTDADKSATKDATPDKESDDADSPSIIAPEPKSGRRANGTIEFRTEQWAEIYSRRIDDTIAALKSKGVPVFWVGLPSIRGSRSTTEMVYLNNLYRARAEKAGAVYIDVWDGFVDESGKFTTNGPDFEGQVRRLRSSDGVYFNKYGARKLAHYVERELRRYMSNRALQVSLPTGPVGPAPADVKSAVRPLAGPVVPLTVIPGNTDELLGGAGSSTARGDAIATQVLVKGEPVAAPTGRADDFAWQGRADVNASQPDSAAPGATSLVEPPDATKKPADPKSTAAAKSKPSDAARQKAQQNDPPRPARRGQSAPPG